MTTTRPSAAITVSDFLSTGLKDVASGIEVSMTVFFDFKLAYLELSEPGREYHIDSDLMHKHTPNKNYICFNCMVGGVLRGVYVKLRLYFVNTVNKR